MRALRPILLLAGALFSLTAVPRCKPVEIDEEKPKAVDSTLTGFKCEGKTFCSEMKSCAEAEYYIDHCPDTQMDGDADGVPCEGQWCG